jgi:hypothetical protein
VRARAVGATDFVQPPVNASALLTKLYGDFQCVRGKPKFCDEASPGIVVALESVQAAFALAWLGAPFDQTAMNGAGAARLVAILAGACPVNRGVQSLL